jgi:hypothetical protein
MSLPRVMWGQQRPAVRAERSSAALLGACGGASNRRASPAGASPDVLDSESIKSKHNFTRQTPRDGHVGVNQGLADVEMR